MSSARGGRGRCWAFLWLRRGGDLGLTLRAEGRLWELVGSRGPLPLLDFEHGAVPTDARTPTMAGSPTGGSSGARRWPGPPPPADHTHPRQTVLREAALSTRARAFRAGCPHVSGRKTVTVGVGPQPMCLLREAPCTSIPVTPRPRPHGAHSRPLITRWKESCGIRGASPPVASALPEPAVCDSHTALRPPRSAQRLLRPLPSHLPVGP